MLIEEISKLIKEGSSKDPRYRKNIKIGTHVKIVLKKDQMRDKAKQKLTEGFVDKILTSKSYHPQGIKVKLTENRGIGRVQLIM